MSGKLYLVATPIGNLGDLSPRAAETLAAADFVAAEDTRVSLKLLNHFNIKKPLVSYHEHNQAAAGPAILNRLLSGETCALVTDAGTPAVSDPGGGGGAGGGASGGGARGPVRRKRRGGPGYPRVLRRRVRPGGERPAHGPLRL